MKSTEITNTVIGSEVLQAELTQAKSEKSRNINSTVGINLMGYVDCVKVISSPDTKPEDGSIEESTYLISDVKQVSLKKTNTRINFMGRKGGFIDNLTVVVFLLFGASVGLASVFYSLWHKWQPSTSLFYSIQVITGAMYGIPEVTDSVSQVVTLALYIWGAGIVTSALSVYVTTVIDEAIKKSREGGLYFIPDTVKSEIKSSTFIESFIKILKWEERKAAILTFLATFMWLVVGVFYGIKFEKYDLFEALYSSIAAMSASGAHPPPCLALEVPNGSTSCQLGDIRGYFMSLYLLIGVPLFTLALGQFSGLAIDNAVRSYEFQKMRQSLSDDEFDFACSFHATDKDIDKTEQINFAEFALTELYRLKRVDSNELIEMREVFNSYDTDGNGYLDKSELITRRVRTKNIL
jgi:hypothetical protein